MKAVLKHFLRLFALLGSIVLLFLVSRWAFYFSNRVFFEQFSATEIFFALINGLEYDALIVLFINTVFIFLFLWPARIYNSIFHQSILKFLFFTINIIALLFNLLDIKLYGSLGHRLRFFEIKAQVKILLQNLSDVSFSIFTNEYLSLVVYLLVFVLVLLLASKLINGRSNEQKNYKGFQKWLSFGLFVIITVLLFYFKVGQATFTTKLYQKADRRLSPLVMNNPYLIYASYMAREIEIGTEWDLEKYQAEKQYKKLPVLQFDKIKLIVIEKKEPSGEGGGDKNFYPLYGLVDQSGTMKLLDELLLSYPGYFNLGFHQSFYSLNRFESLVEILQKNGFQTNLEMAGYDEEIVKLVGNFYGFGGKKKPSGTNRQFELFMVNAKVDEQNILLANTEILGDNELIIRVECTPVFEVGENKLAKRISFTSTKKLPFYNGIDSIIAQNADILPSILHLTGYTEPFISYGNSLFANDEKLLFQTTSDSSVVAIKDSLMINYVNGETLGLRKVLNGKFSKYDFKDSLAVERIVVENKLRSLIFDYKKRLVDGSLY